MVALNAPHKIKKSDLGAPEKKLLEDKASNLNPNQRYTTLGHTALFLAVQMNHLDIVEYLLSLDEIDVNLMSDDDTAPLHLAAFRGYSDIVKALLTTPRNKFK